MILRTDKLVKSYGGREVVKEVSVEVGEVQEVLTDNAQLALHGALWELDQDIAALGTDEARLVATD